MLGDNGLVLTGAIAPGDQVDFGSNPLEAAARFVTGAASGPFINAQKGWTAYKTTGDPVRGIEEVMPRTVHNLMTAYRMGKTGRLDNITGKTILENPSAFTIAAKAASLYPTEIQTRQEMTGAGINLDKKLDAETTGLANRSAGLS